VEANGMSVLRVITIGNSVGVILPKEILKRLGVGTGDNLYVVETKTGIQLTAYDPSFAQQVEAAECVMHEDVHALKKLAE
jgi:putative addiction module antidote